jgi:hypothetical protein
VKQKTGDHGFHGRRLIGWMNQERCFVELPWRTEKREEEEEKGRVDGCCE